MSTHPKLTTGQAAKALGVHRLTLLRWIHDGHLPEPELVYLGNVKYRFFSQADLRRAAAYQRRLHTGGKGQGREER